MITSKTLTRKPNNNINRDHIKRVLHFNQLNFLTKLLTLQVDRRVARVLRDVGGGRLHKQNSFRQNSRVQTEKTGLSRFFSGSNRFFRVIGLIVAVEAQLVAGQVAPGLVPAGGANRLPGAVRISEK
jgi:hypothetical protein